MDPSPALVTRHQGGGDKASGDSRHDHRRGQDILGNPVRVIKFKAQLNLAEEHWLFADGSTAVFYNGLLGRLEPKRNIEPQPKTEDKMICIDRHKINRPSGILSVDPNRWCERPDLSMDRRERNPAFHRQCTSDPRIDSKLLGSDCPSRLGCEESSAKVTPVTSGNPERIKPAGRGDLIKSGTAVATDAPQEVTWW